MRYVIVIERGEGNYGAYAPDVPGCAAVGDTLDEVKREFAEALQFHFEGLSEEGQPIPAPTSMVAAWSKTASFILRWWLEDP